ncbi:hypothetical protein M513_13764 [Trichuris suis]|uniref:Uncharacterized protein n=1 Tax=Trichuris suis TaxID=68888 RepID=A0A085LK63_9BILA|nr:hypothetical protein M513_13764 [Trichuris suis]
MGKQTSKRLQDDIRSSRRNSCNVIACRMTYTEDMCMNQWCGLVWRQNHPVVCRLLGMCQLGKNLMIWKSKWSVNMSSLPEEEELTTLTCGSRAPRSGVPLNWL